MAGVPLVNFDIVPTTQFSSLSLVVCRLSFAVSLSVSLNFSVLFVFSAMVFTTSFWLVQLTCQKGTRSSVRNLLKNKVIRRSTIDPVVKSRKCR